MRSMKGDDRKYVKLYKSFVFSDFLQMSNV